jgi:hypothetical protein
MACSENSICGGLRRLVLLHVCIYRSAPARLTAHPHLKLPLQAIVHSTRNFRIRFKNSGIVVEFSINRSFAENKTYQGYSLHRSSTDDMIELEKEIET